MKFKDDLDRAIWYVSQIDYSYWMLQEISKHSGKMESPLEAMIDRATGFDVEKVRQRINHCILLARTIIRCKTKMGYDAGGDKKFLLKLIELRRDSKKAERITDQPGK